jgi:hypothetical protein
LKSRQRCKRAENGLQVQRAIPVLRVEAEAFHTQVLTAAFLVAKAAYIDLNELRQLAGEVFDMDAGAAVDVRRVFVGEKECFHAGVRERGL